MCSCTRPTRSVFAILFVIMPRVRAGPCAILQAMHAMQSHGALRRAVVVSKQTTSGIWAPARRLLQQCSSASCEQARRRCDAVAPVAHWLPTCRRIARGAAGCRASAHGSVCGMRAESAVSVSVVAASHAARDEPVSQEIAQQNAYSVCGQVRRCRR